MDSLAIPVHALKDRVVSGTAREGARIDDLCNIPGNGTSQAARLANINLAHCSTCDMLDRLETVTDSAGRATHHSYDAAGNLTRTELPDGAIETREYDQLNRLVCRRSRTRRGLITSHRHILAPTGRSDASDRSNRLASTKHEVLRRPTTEQIADAFFSDHISNEHDEVGGRLAPLDLPESTRRWAADEVDLLLVASLAGQAGCGMDSSTNRATEAAFSDWDFDNRLIAAGTQGDLDT